jgi:hypothetical protein
MYYTPAVVIPGKVAHLTLEEAQASARNAGTYILDEDGNIIEDYRPDVEDAIADGSFSIDS